MGKCRYDLSEDCHGKDCLVCTLDKIRAEIEEGYCVVNNDYDHGRNYGLYIAIQIINKYRTRK